MSPLPRNILLIDDDLTFVRQLAEQLIESGHSAHCCQTPESALDAARETAFAAVIVEPNLRGMAWVRFLRAIRTTLGAADIVVVTAFGSTAMLAEAMDLGVRSFVVKPVEPRVLVDLLDGTAEHPSAPPDENDELTLDRWEWEYLNNVLRRCDGNVSEACRRLGIPRQTLYYKLRKQPTSMPSPARQAESPRSTETPPLRPGKRAHR